MRLIAIVLALAGCGEDGNCPSATGKSFATTMRLTGGSTDMCDPATSATGVGLIGSSVATREGCILGNRQEGCEIVLVSDCTLEFADGSAAEVTSRGLLSQTSASPLQYEGSAEISIEPLDGSASWVCTYDMAATAE